MGKLLVFESGAVKLQMGEVLLDVSLGSVCGFRQDVAATSTAGAGPGHFLQLGKLEARLVASPDIGQLLKCVPCPRRCCWARGADPLAHQHPGLRTAIPQLEARLVASPDIGQLLKWVEGV